MANNFTLLLVEPSKALQQSISDILRNDFNIEQVILADSHAQSLHYLAENTAVNCIIVNSQLPDSSGFDLISAIKQLEHYTSTSVLLMSEQQDRSHLLQAAACGASDFIIKPFTDRSFMLKLKKMITGQEFRVAARVATFEAVQLEVDFGETQTYQARLTDISIGGCSIICERFTKGGCVYDVADIHFKCHNKSFSLSAELVRIECNPENEDDIEKELLAAFKFKELSAHHQQQVHNFISELNAF